MVSTSTSAALHGADRDDGYDDRSGNWLDDDANQHPAAADSRRDRASCPAVVYTAHSTVWGRFWRAGERSGYHPRRQSPEAAGRACYGTGHRTRRTDPTRSRTNERRSVPRTGRTRRNSATAGIARSDRQYANDIL